VSRAAHGFPPPWTVEDKDAYFIVRDHNGQALAYVYAEDKRSGAKPLTRDEARRIAANIGAATAAGGVGARTQLARAKAPSEQKNPAGLGGKFCWAVRWSGF
jgi:hypothetical protein